MLTRTRQGANLAAVFFLGGFRKTPLPMALSKPIQETFSKVRNASFLTTDLCHIEINITLLFYL